MGRGGEARGTAHCRAMQLRLPMVCSQQTAQTIRVVVDLPWLVQALADYAHLLATLKLQLGFGDDRYGRYRRYRRCISSKRVNNTQRRS